MKSLSQAIQFFLRLFYDPILYKDIAFREQGYGIKRAIIFLFVLTIPSYVMLIYKINQSYQTEWKSQIEKIPYLKLEQGRVFQTQQSFQSNQILKQLDMRWLPPYQFPNLSGQKEFPGYFLGTVNLFVKVSNYNLFGLNIIDKNMYIPLPYTKDYQGQVVSGYSIIESTRLTQLIAFSTMIWLMSFSVGALFLFSFLRTFAFVAKKMVGLFMHEQIQYASACRLLSATGIIPLAIVAISMNFMPYQDHYKYFYLAIYMFNFYFAVRLISMRSLSRWISPSA